MKLAIWALVAVGCTGSSIVPPAVPQTVNEAVKFSVVQDFPAPEAGRARVLLAATSNGAMVFRDDAELKVQIGPDRIVTIVRLSEMGTFRGAFSLGPSIYAWGDNGAWTVDGSGTVYKSVLLESFLQHRPSRVILARGEEVFVLGEAALLLQSKTELRVFPIANAGRLNDVAISFDALGGFVGYVATQKGLLRIRNDESGFALAGSYDTAELTHVGIDAEGRVFVRDIANGMWMLHREQFFAVLESGVGGIVRGTQSSLWILPSEASAPVRWMRGNAIKQASPVETSILSSSGGMWIKTGSSWREWSLAPRVSVQWQNPMTLTASGCSILRDPSSFSFQANGEVEAMECSFRVSSASDDSSTSDRFATGNVSLEPSALSFGRNEVRSSCSSSNTEFPSQLSFCLDVRFIPTWFADIKPLMVEHCAECHGPKNGSQCNANVACWPLTNFENWSGDANTNLRAARALANTQPDNGGLVRMPPTRPMSSEEQDMLQAWFDAGKPRGEGSEQTTPACTEECQ